MRNTVLVITFILICGKIWAQKTGDQYKKEGNLDSAMYTYGAQSFANPTDTEVAYKLATTLGLMNYEVDTAFFFLRLGLQNNNSLLPLADSDLYFLSFDPRWEAIEEMQFKKYQEENGTLKNPEYAKRLIRIIQKDQALRYFQHQANPFYVKHERAPHWLYPILAFKARNVQENYTEVMNLLDQYGWPTYSMVGDLAADAPLLVINHVVDEETRMKYLPQIKEACFNSEGSCMEFAKIQDRILVNTGKPQIYGMQFQYNEDRQLEPFPIQDPEYVDQRRKEIGLEPLKDYLKRKIDYDFKVAQLGK